MARKDRGLLGDLFEIATFFPWWVGVTLAVASYLGLHHLALAKPPAITDPGGFGGLLGAQLHQKLALIFQYVIPPILLAGALYSAIQRRQRKALASGFTAGEAASVLGEMSWEQFEDLVADAWRLEGYTVQETGGASPDGGVDLVLRKGSEKFLVQCKHWRAQKVSVTIVRELYGVMAARGASGGFVVTSGTFTKDAKEFARGRNIELIDGNKLFEMFKKVRRSAATPPPVSLPSRATSATPPLSSAPACPRCSKPMVHRTARRGANAGKAFWGCPGYPSCNGTREID